MAKRLQWHNEVCIHWIVRRNISLSENYGEDGEDGEEYLLKHYMHYLSDSFIKRFEFYHDIVDRNPLYRRASPNFSMALEQDFKVGAVARREVENDQIYIKLGMVLAVEEAAQAIFSNPSGLFTNEVLDLWASEKREGTHCLSFHSKNYFDYEDLAQEQGNGSAPVKLGALFSHIPASHSLQHVADSFSCLSLIWVMGHEDAHRYLGHLNYFCGELGAASFEELLADYDADKSWLRRSAEFEADVASCMRLVDSYYDKQLFECILFSPACIELLGRWPHLEADVPFGVAERNFALRFMAGAAILPIIIFQIEIEKLSKSQSENYPRFAFRVINILFQILDRVIAAQEVGKDSYRVGRVETWQEVLLYFRLAMKDVQAMTDRLGLNVSEGRSFNRCELKMFSEDMIRILAADFCFRNEIPAPENLSENSTSEDYICSYALFVNYTRAQRESYSAILDVFQEPWMDVHRGTLRELKIVENLYSTRERKKWLDQHLHPLEGHFLI